MTTLYTFVTGPAGSGKSSFLYALGDPADCWVDEDAGLEYRYLTVDESLEVYLFCSLDPSRFDRLLELEQRDLLGYIIMVDSTDPDSWAEARAMSETCRGFALLPTVIAANKQDIAGAATPNEVAIAVSDLDAMTRVQGSVAVDTDSARNLFLQLLYSVNHEIERLDALIAELERLAETDNK
jgi:signal recognition particle receptor subunit beta